VAWLPATNVPTTPVCLNMTTISPLPDAATVSPPPVPAPGGAATVLDAQALANLSQLDPQGTSRLVQRVLTTYRGSLARLMGQLSQARADSDQAQLRLVTHTLKSSSASVGALSLSALCSAAEQAVRDGDLGALPTLLDSLQAEAARVDAAVSQLLSAP
jgi:HPt (histidine-containing phosphotransfer) domain-containing protein